MSQLPPAHRHLSSTAEKTKIIQHDTGKKSLCYLYAENIKDCFTNVMVKCLVQTLINAVLNFN